MRPIISDSDANCYSLDNNGINFAVYQVRVQSG
jgi:hypothetical protein